MDMQVDAQLIRNERLKRAWSQEQLAEVSGLGLRTVQRIECGSNSSLETLKALAAVLELPVEDLQADSVKSEPVLIPPVRFRLFKPWPAFAAGGALTLLALGSLFNMQGAFAEKVAMEFDVTVNEEKLSISSISSESGSPVALELKEQLRVKLVPTVRENGFVQVNAEIYLIEDGEPRLLARPSIQTKDGKPAMFRVGGDRAFAGDESMMLELLVTPTIE